MFQRCISHDGPSSDITSTFIFFPSSFCLSVQSFVSHNGSQSFIVKIACIFVIANFIVNNVRFGNNFDFNAKIIVTHVAGYKFGYKWQVVGLHNPTIGVVWSREKDIYVNLKGKILLVLWQLSEISRGMRSAKLVSLRIPNARKHYYAVLVISYPTSMNCGIQMRQPTHKHCCFLFRL